MLAPEVWNFSPPSNSLIIKNNLKDNIAIDKCIDSHSFNHMVSVVLPDTVSPPSSIEEALSIDCDYYLLRDLDVSLLLEENFIRGFIKQGDVTLMSIGTKIDVDDCIAITPTGHLVLSLRREAYQELGLEGTPTFTRDKEPQRYMVCVDLTSDDLVPGKHKYENTRKALKERLHTNFTVLLAWDPIEANVCPSSIAAYFASQNCIASLCRPKKSLSQRYRVDVPVINSSQPVTVIEEFLEWLGALSIGVPLDREPDGDLSSYHSSLEHKETSSMAVLTWSGFFTRKQISHLVTELSDLMVARKSLPWISIHVQGFEDSPTNWGLKEHRYYTDGDNSFTVILESGGTRILATHLSNQRLCK